MIFLGPLFPKHKELEILNNTLTHSIQNQANSYQWNLIKGLEENGQDIKIINVLPVGTYPRQYSKPILEDVIWGSDKKNIEVGSVNLPIIKQFTRCRKIKILLSESDDKNIVIYSAYLPFLKAVCKLDKTFHITLIVTDLPEFYDLGNTSALRRLVRKINTKLVYKYMSRVDSFVLLTEAMKDRIPVVNKPYTVIEGIYSDSDKQLPLKPLENKKVIFYSGTLHYIYGIKNLLDAFSMIEDPNVELWICGSGEAEAEIKQRSQLDSRIRFYGFCTSEKVAELRSHATVLVNPRTNEGEYTKYSFPSKTMEYMASGIPIVMYKLSGIPKEYEKYINYPLNESISSLKFMISDICNDNSGMYKEKSTSAELFIKNNKNTCVQSKKLINQFRVL